jgi:hypothetical protein
VLLVDDGRIADEPVVVGGVVVVRVDHLDDPLAAFEDEQLVGVADGDEEPALADAVHVVDVEPIGPRRIVGGLVAGTRLPLPGHLAALDDHDPFVFHVREDEPTVRQGFDVVDFAGDPVAHRVGPLGDHLGRGLGVDDPVAGAVTGGLVGATVLVAARQVAREHRSVVESRHVEVDVGRGLPPPLFGSREHPDGTAVDVAPDALDADDGRTLAVRAGRRGGGRIGTRRAGGAEGGPQGGRGEQAQTAEDDEGVAAAEADIELDVGVEPGGHLLYVRRRQVRA